MKAIERGRIHRCQDVNDAPRGGAKPKPQEERPRLSQPENEAMKKVTTPCATSKGPAKPQIDSLVASLMAAGAFLGPGVCEDIEIEIGRTGGHAVGRRIGTALLSRPFRTIMKAIQLDPDARVEMAAALTMVRESASAHRDVAAILETAVGRLELALLMPKGKVIKIERSAA